MSDSNDENAEFFDGAPIKPTSKMAEYIQILKEFADEINRESLAAATKQYMDTKKEE